jgi:hypothetical protein
MMYFTPAGVVYVPEPDVNLWTVGFVKEVLASVIAASFTFAVSTALVANWVAPTAPSLRT